MENATKALLIAAAILIAILIISLALVVYNMATETIGDINLSEAQITEFNSKFEQYKGNNVSGTSVNALIKTVFNHNITEDEAGRKVSIVGTNAPSLSGTAVELPDTMADTGSTYQVQLVYSTTSGLIHTINVSKKN